MYLTSVLDKKIVPFCHQLCLEWRSVLPSLVILDLEILDLLRKSLEFLRSRIL